MDVPNLAGIMDEIKLEEDRIAAEKEVLRQSLLNNVGQVGPDGNPIPPQPPKVGPDGKPIPPKPGDPNQPPVSGPGSKPPVNPNPDEQRLLKNRPPRIPATGGRLANSRN
jgi:hypothetical protein